MLSICQTLCGVLFLAVISETKQDQSCAPYPYLSIDHGHINHVNRHTFTFHCDKGYYLTASSKVRCRNGNWTSLKEPKCNRASGLCDDPPPLENGIIIGDDRRIGDTVMYICNEGFILMGNPERECSRSGYWSGRTPSCMHESEPIQKVAERLQHSFITEMKKYTGHRHLDPASLLHGLEMVILLDRSSSVDPVHLEDAKIFVNFLLEKFNVKNGANNKGGTRAAVLAFGTEVHFVFNVDNATINGMEAARKAVSSIQPNGGGTNMEGAMTQVILKVIPVVRPKAKRALFMMTDGEPNINNPAITPQDIARQLKRDHDFEIFTVGIGKGINRRLLAELASEPPLSHVFVLDQYPNLNDIMEIVKDTKPDDLPISEDHCGYEAPDEYRDPWIAAVYIGGGVLKICGGVLICSQWVLTAASCVEDENGKKNMKDVFVSLGERDLMKTEKNQTNFYVTDMRIHPAYNAGLPLQDNLVLLKLNLPSTGYRPACLPRTDVAIRLHQDLDINANIAGWGRTAEYDATPANAGTVNFKMETTPVSLAEEGECPGKKNSIPLICAGQGTQTCLGLMGSPLMAVDKFTHYHHVIGTVVGRSHCLKANNQYVELTRYINWINQQTANCQLKHWGLQN